MLNTSIILQESDHIDKCICFTLNRFIYASVNSNRFIQFIVYDSIDIGILNWLRSLCAIQSKMSFASRNAPLASLAKASLKLISLVRFRSQLDRAESITVVTIDCSPYFYSIEPPIGFVYRSQSRKVSCGRQATTHGRILPCVCTSKYEYMLSLIHI